MNIAIDSSPLQSGHSVRGIGSYTKNLIEVLSNFSPDVKINPFNDSNPPKSDIIHYPFFDLFFHTLPIRRNSLRIVTIHDLIPLVYPKHFSKGIKGFINLFLQKVALKNTDFIISDSESTKKDIIEILNFPQNRIGTVYLAPDPKFKKLTLFAKQKAASKLRLPQNYCLYVGDVNWNKNLETLLEAVKISNAKIVMVGAALTDTNISETQSINNLIKKLGISDQVIKTGYIKSSDLVDIYNLASVTLLPSFYEGFGLPVLESMACGTPVICSKNSSLSEIGADLAFYCNPSSASDIADKIKEVSGINDNHKNILSQKLEDHAKKFTWQRVAGETIEIYRKVFKY